MVTCQCYRHVILTMKLVDRNNWNGDYADGYGASVLPGLMALHCIRAFGFRAGFRFRV